ncbi:MAG: hypothetical protein ABJ239_07160 [Erythrobacter sp.]
MSGSNNSWTFDLDQIEADLERHGRATTQFNNPIGDTLSIVQVGGSSDPDDWPQISSAEYLARLNAMCRIWGEKLEVRFYGHHSDAFDGRTLLRIPEVRSLSVDSIFEANNLEAIGELQHLTQLHLGIFELADKAILAKLPLDRLTHLTLSPTQTKALDLSRLESATALKKLYLDGHYKNIATLAALDGLEEFTFNPKKSLDLGFINGMASLLSLKLVLGGTESIAEIALDGLQDLACTQVLGLADLGDMQRFGALQRLLVQDQKQLAGVQFGSGNRQLEHVWFYNCPALTKIAGLADCAKLQSLRWLFTDSDPAALDLPKSLTHLHMLPEKRAAQAGQTSVIEGMGYIADDHPNAEFFYK